MMANSSEQTPLIHTNSSVKEVGHTTTTTTLCNLKCFASFAIFLVVLSIISILAAAAVMLPEEKIQIPFTSISIDTTDALQWCILIGAFMLSTISLYISTRTNNNRIIMQQRARPDNKQLQHNMSDQQTDDDATSLLKTKQQRAMLSLAIIVCNYADLFVLANQYLRQQQSNNNNNNNNNESPRSSSWRDGNNSRRSTTHQQQYQTNIINQYSFLFTALQTTSNQMLSSINKVFEVGLTHEIISSHAPPDAKDQFTLYTARLLDAINDTNVQHATDLKQQQQQSPYEKWSKRTIIEGNERLLIQIMSYITNNNDRIGGEQIVNPILGRIDGLLNVHLHLLEESATEHL